MKSPSDQNECPLTRRSWRLCSRRDSRRRRPRCGSRTRSSPGSFYAPFPACICCGDPGRRRMWRSASPWRCSGFRGSGPHSPPRAGGRGRPRSDWLSWASGSRPGTGRGSTGCPWCRPGVCTVQDTLRVGKEEQGQVKEEMNPMNAKCVVWKVKVTHYELSLSCGERSTGNRSLSPINHIVSVPQLS